MRYTTCVAIACVVALSSALPARGETYRAVLFPQPQGAVYRVNAVDGDRLTGNVLLPGVPSHAALFAPDFSSYVDLHPAGATTSAASGAGGGQQVGVVDGAPAVWSGTAGSVVYLLPEGATGASVNATNGTRQVGSAQGGPFGVSHAILWNNTAAGFTDLHAAGYRSSLAAGLGAERQVGRGVPTGADSIAQTHALLWRGTADSVVSLNPAGYLYSAALGIAGDQVVGQATPDVSPGVPNRAALWDLSTGRFVELHPAQDYRQSHASITNGDLQLGIGITPTGRQHALLWDDTPDSIVNLHELLGPGFERSSVAGFDATGNVYGMAFRPDGSYVPVRWEVIPEPGALWALGALGGTLTLRRRACR